MSRRNAPAPADGTEPPGLAILVNVPAPYRVHLHRRIAAGIREFRLHSLFTHAHDGLRSPGPLPPEINAVHFGPGEVPSNWRPWHDWRKGAPIIRYLHAHNIRALICHGYYHATNVRVLIHCRRHGIRTFFRSDSNVRQDNLRQAWQRWAKNRFVRWVLRRCDAFLPVGSLCQQFYERYGADPRRCFWVPFEPDYEFFATAPADELADFRGRHNLDSKRHWLLYSGRLTPLKRVDLLLDAFAAIAPQRPDWGLLIAGDGPLRQQLRDRLGHPLRPAVRWLGLLEVDQVRLAYHAADALVLPSDKEPWALVVNEAMAAGLPVVASDMVGAAADLIRDGVNGKVIAAGDAVALAAALRDLTDNDNYPRYREAVGPVLDSWRVKADPVVGLRRALSYVGLIGGPKSDAAVPLDG